MRPALRDVVLLSLALPLLACSRDSEPAQKLGVDEPAPEGYLVGIRPEDFACSSLFDMPTATEIFGGRVEQVESPYTPPVGVPASCNYVSFAEGREPLRWSFDSSTAAKAPMPTPAN